MGKLFYYKVHEIWMYVLMGGVVIFSMMPVFEGETDMAFLIGLIVVMCELLGIIVIIGIVDNVRLSSCAGRFYSKCDPFGATEYLAKTIDYYYDTKSKRQPYKIIYLELRYINALCSSGGYIDAGIRLTELEEKYGNEFKQEDMLLTQCLKVDIALATENIQSVMEAYISYEEMIEKHSGRGTIEKYKNNLTATQIRIDLLKGHIDQQDIWLKSNIEQEKMQMTKISRTFLLGEVLLKQNKVELAMEQFHKVIDCGNKHLSVDKAKAYINEFQK